MTQMYSQPRRQRTQWPERVDAPAASVLCRACPDPFRCPTVADLYFGADFVDRHFALYPFAVRSGAACATHSHAVCSVCRRLGLGRLQHADDTQQTPALSRDLFNTIRSFIADLELYLQMCTRPVQHWGYFLLGSLGTYEGEKVHRSHVVDLVGDYAAFKQGVETIFGKYEFEGSYRAQLRSKVQSGSESVAAYAARTTGMCSKAYTNFTTETQLSLAYDHNIAGLADATWRGYLLHDRACRALTWQETVQMAQACEASRLSFPLSSVTAASAKVGARSSVDDDTSTCSVGTPLQQSSARAGRVNESAHSSCTSKQHVTDDHARSRKSKKPSP